MLHMIKLQEFVQQLFDRPDIARKAGLIIQAILEARSPRLSDLSHKLPGKPDPNYKSKILTRDAATLFGQGGPSPGFKALQHPASWLMTSERQSPFSSLGTRKGSRGATPVRLASPLNKKTRR